MILNIISDEWVGQTQILINIIQSQMKTQQALQDYFKRYLSPTLGSDNEKVILLIIYFLISAAISTSQFYGLEWEAYIFQTMVTLFNLQIVRVFLCSRQVEYINIRLYFESGAFLLLSLLMDLVLGCHYHALTFTLHCALMSYMIDRSKCRISVSLGFTLLSYILQTALFLNLDRILVIDTRWILGILFLGFFYRLWILLQHYFSISVLNNKKIQEFGRYINLIYNVGVIVIVFQLFCFYFLSSTIYRLVIVTSLLIHLVCLSLTIYHQGTLFLHYFLFMWGFFNRKTQNSFIRDFKLPFNKTKPECSNEFCSKCSRYPASVLFSCGHLLFCKKCYFDQRMKTIQTCYLCDCDLKFVCDLTGSLGVLLQSSIQQIVQKQRSFYDFYPMANVAHVGQQVWDVFFNEEILTLALNPKKNQNGY